MKDLRQRQVEEARRRLKMLQDKGLHENVLAEFDEDNTVYYSERIRMGGLVAGILYWVRNRQRFVDVVRAFEEEMDAVVYHATYEHMIYGDILDLFYVSKHTEEWEQDRRDLQVGCPFVRAVNLDDDILSDFGYINYKISGGGLIRTA